MFNNNLNGSTYCASHPQKIKYKPTSSYLHHRGVIVRFSDLESGPVSYLPNLHHRMVKEFSYHMGYTTWQGEHSTEHGADLWMTKYFYSTIETKNQFEQRKQEMDKNTGLLRSTKIDCHGNHPWFPTHISVCMTVASHYGPSFYNIPIWTNDRNKLSDAIQVGMDHLRDLGVSTKRDLSDQVTFYLYGTDCKYSLSAYPGEEILNHLDRMIEFFEEEKLKLHRAQAATIIAEADDVSIDDIPKQTDFDCFYRYDYSAKFGNPRGSIGISWKDLDKIYEDIEASPNNYLLLFSRHRPEDVNFQEMMQTTLCEILFKNKVAVPKYRSELDNLIFLLCEIVQTGGRERFLEQRKQLIEAKVDDMKVAYEAEKAASEKRKAQYEIERRQSAAITERAQHKKQLFQEAVSRYAKGDTIAAATTETTVKDELLQNVEPPKNEQTMPSSSPLLSESMFRHKEKEHVDETDDNTPVVATVAGEQTPHPVNKEDSDDNSYVTLPLTI